MVQAERSRVRLRDVRGFTGELYDHDLHAKRVDALAGATLGVMAGASLAVAVAVAVAMIGQCAPVTSVSRLSFAVDSEQYRAFHGSEPPRHWREATTADIHAAVGHERPHLVFLSAPVI